MNEGEEVQPAGPNFMWTEALNSLLIQCMVELMQWHQVHHGSFKNGSFDELERMIEEKAPGCGVKVHPNCKNLNKKLFPHYDELLKVFGKFGPVNGRKTQAEELCGLKPVISKALDALGKILGEHEEYTVKEAALMLEIGKIAGLERGQVLDAAMVLVENDRKTRLFFALENEEDRKYFIQNLLR
ncbi:unnamed protein product [Linum tenue]|uniref:Uncharacterized protein n=1 Tax=Linum tenue TaxID=586396 RepID=A0AAV0J4S3_9ROSI|nr:unnamed protein product [Linum tenue]